MVERNSLTNQGDETDSERSAREIRQDIAAKRESIADTVDRLSDRFQRTLDWRTYAAEYPLVALGVAAGAGFLVARIFRPKPSPRDRIMDAVADSVAELRERFSEQLDLVPAKRFAPGKTVKAALVAMVTKAATDYLKDRVLGPSSGTRPSSETHYTNAEQAKGVSSAR